MSTGRHAPCPCGSGKKFKNCHGKGRASANPSKEATWRRIRRAIDGAPSKTYRFIRDTYGPDAVDDAWGEFTLWDDEEPYFDPDSPHVQLFMPWFFHRWAPDPDDTSVLDPELHGRVPTSLLLERRGRRLEPLLRRYLEACLEAPFTFFEILRVDPGKGFAARDVFTGTEHEVWERSASHAVTPGVVLFAQVVVVDGVAMMEATSPYLFPRSAKLELIDLRERIRSQSDPITVEALDDWDIELREEYLRLIDHVLSPQLPRLQNTDGEDIVFHRMVFEIDSPRGAFDALMDLAYGESEADLLDGADFDDAGDLHSVRFSWKVAGNPKMAGWDNTVHGEVEIDGRELIARVNSAGRAERLRTMIADRLGESARHLRTEVQTIEEARSASEDAPVRAQGGEDLADHPQVVAAVREMLAAHYEAWVSTDVPALGGLTPLQAVRTPAGREKVRVLVDEMEERGRGMRPPVDPAAIRRLRERLGLI